MKESKIALVVKKPAVSQSQTSRRMCRKVLDQDQFSQQFRMKIHEEFAALPSPSGLVFTLILFIILFGYFVQKTDILLNRRDVDVMLAVKQNFYDENYVFDYD